MKPFAALAATLLALAPLHAAGLSAPDLAKQIDQQVQAKLNAEKLPASPLCDDAEFIRRASLDLTGVIPPAEKVAEFLDSKDPDKRAKLIDDLLASPNFGRRMADIWLGLLIDRTSDNRRLDYNPFHAWLAEKYNANTPWDKFVSELVTATGPQDKNGAVTYFFSNNTVDKMTDSVTKLFLGVQLQCAQCHNHPFTGWKQQEYWGMAQFFTKVRFNGNANQVAKKGTSPEVSEDGKGKGPALPTSAVKTGAKFLQGESPAMPSGPYRPVLAQWLVAKENPYFARAMTNRLWHQMFGRGFVNPVDDMHKDNHPSHPELLKLMAEEFMASDFDVKHLLRSICNSQTYQRTSKPLEDNADDDILLSKMAIKVLTPEQLYDSLEAVLGKNARGQGANRPQQAANRGAPGSPRDAFVAFFAGEEGASPTEYQSGVPQALRLMNAALYNNPNCQLLQEANKLGKPEQAIERLFLGALSRRPTAAEYQKLVAYVGKASDAKTAYSDILWAILNSSEFTLNH